MRRLLTGTVLFLAALTLVKAQAPVKSPTFDVAAVKENTSGENAGRIGGPASRFVATNEPALQLIVFAYDLPAFRIDGAPDWARNLRFDINAKAEAEFPVAQPDAPDPRRLMMRALLADRFKLVTHTESKPLPIYKMVQAKPDRSLGPNIHPSSTDCAALIAAYRRGQGPTSPPLTRDGNEDCGNITLPGRMNLGTQSLAQLAVMLSNALRRPVIDHTGLTGNYSATLTWTPDVAGESPATVKAADRAAASAGVEGGSIFTAIQDQLGLRLESAKAPVDVLVIDHVEKPTPD